MLVLEADHLVHVALSGFWVLEGDPGFISAQQVLHSLSHLSSPTYICSWCHVHIKKTDKVDNNKRHKVQAFFRKGLQRANILILAYEFKLWT